MCGHHSYYNPNIPGEDPDSMSRLFPKKLTFEEWLLEYAPMEDGRISELQWFEVIRDREIGELVWKAAQENKQ